MIRNRTPLEKTALVTGIAAAIGAISTLLLPVVPGGAESFGFESVYPLLRVGVFVSTFILLMILALMWSYISLYRDLPNKYSLSLVILSVTLFLYALTSNPLLQLQFGVSPIGELGPFLFIPDLFMGIAIIILFYQSQT